MLCPKKRGEKNNSNIESKPHNPPPKRNPNNPTNTTPAAPTSAHTK